MIPFTNPFRYVPHPLVRKAAREIVERLDRQIAEGELPSEVAKGFREGKMLGVLICSSKGYHPEEEHGSDLRILYSFSGSVGGTSNVEGFVPPIFDLTEDKGYYRRHEAEISAINKEVESIVRKVFNPLSESLKESCEARDEEILRLKELKKSASGIAESQFANGEIKRAKDRWKSTIGELEGKINEVRQRISELKKLRATKSDELQKWIFSQYIVHNASGEKASILEIFQRQGIIPPGGTGDCAAPKLLNYAYLNDLQPVAMGEFWYGKSPSTAVRTHGHFYPSCTSKCGPLLGFMIKGLIISSVGAGWENHGHPWPCEWEGPNEVGRDLVFPSCTHRGNWQDIIYEDEDILVAVKPSGMPSVPGLDGRQSLQEWLMETRGSQAEDIRAVHRLDMDTSGIIIFSKNAEAEADLKRQFEEHTVRKTYMARLSPADPHNLSSDVPTLNPGDKGKIELPMNPDYDERPRQKVDHVQGKAALTEYEVVSVRMDGCIDILFYPHTGRTHQLRVHSAHLSGLGRPILGDLLYGGCGNIWSESGESRPSRNSNESMEYRRLHLHAHSITFRHPSTGELLTFSAPRPF